MGLLTYNDIHTKAPTLAPTTDTADVTSGKRCRIISAEISGAGAASIGLFDATATGAINTSTIQVKNGGGTSSKQVFFGPNGIRFENGLSVIYSGTTPVGRVFYLEDGE